MGKHNNDTRNGHDHRHDNGGHSDHHGDHDGHGGHDHHAHHAAMIEDFKKRFWICLVLTIPLLVMAPMIQELLGYEFRFKSDRIIQFLLASVIFFYGGWPFLKGLVDEIKDGKPGMMTLIALAITVAYVYSSAVVFGLTGQIFFWELASLIVIMLLGHWIEMRSVMSASGALQELAKILPDEAIVIGDDGSTEEVKTTDLEKGDLLLIKPGQKIPADGIIREGESALNESMLTGESKPVSKGKGDEVIGGSINGSGSLKVEVKSDSEHSYLSRMIDMVQSAQRSKSKTQTFADRAAGWLFYIAVGAGILTLTAWLVSGAKFDYALERMVTVLVISCPHALGLAIPLVVAISTSLSAKNGLLIRNRTAFENTRKLTAIVFDKTGTLTKGEFGVTHFESLTESMNDEDVLFTAASIEQDSEHPIAAGILRKAKELDIELESPSAFSNITGAGVKAKLKDKEYIIAGPSYLDSHSIKTPEQASDHNDATLTFLIHDDEVIGIIALADEVRPESLEAIEALQKQDIKVLMATGDNEQVAKAVSNQLGLDKYYAGVLPEQKQDIIAELQEEGEYVAMTGDGVNDAPALAKADIGIAVGSGTDVAAETADIILVNSNPSDIVQLIQFGNSTYRKMVQNLFWAAGYNIFAIPLAAGVLSGIGIILSPAVGAVLMSLSTVVVAVNAKLLGRSFA